jgi:hypothetical protein
MRFISSSKCHPVRSSRRSALLLLLLLEYCCTAGRCTAEVRQAKQCLVTGHPKYGAVGCRQLQVFAAPILPSTPAVSSNCLACVHELLPEVGFADAYRHTKMYFKHFL